MRADRGRRTHGRRPLAAAALLLAALGCNVRADKPPAKAAPASEVKKLPGEADLTTVTLSEAAVKRLAIGTGRVVEKRVPQIRTLGGEVMIPPGRLRTVSAPVSGTLQEPAGVGPLAAGDRVAADRVVFDLVPLLTPEARATMEMTLVEAEGQVEQAEKQLASAQLLSDRAERLRRDRLGGAGAVEDAKAQLDIAASALEAAKGRRDAFAATVRSLEGETMAPVRIAADADGVIRNFLAGPGQKIAAGAPLFEIMDADPVLVRVPVYVGDLARLDPSRPVAVGGLSDPPGAPTREGKPVPAPPTADPLGSTADYYYEVANADGGLRPGQRVGVGLRLIDEQGGLVVPHAAVLRDFDGGSWVYTVASPGSFVRRRVVVAAVVDGEALLRSGPPAGTEVVTDGAAELFGVEFGGNK